MKKILALLLMVSVVAGMTLPAMAKTDASAGSSSNGGTNTADIDIGLTGSNTAANSVSVTLNVAPQTNNIGKNIAASGSNTNGALATFAGKAEAEDANSGAAVSGGSGSGPAISGGAGASVDKVKVGEENSGDVNTNPEAETGSAKSTSKTGDATSGDAKNIAKVQDNTNYANANNNDLTSGNVDNKVIQINANVQIVPVEINNEQRLVQKVKLHNDQDASSNPVTIAKAKSTESTTDFDLGAGHDLEIETFPFVW